MKREIHISPAMLEAGTAEVLGSVGGADLGGHFSAEELASNVYRVMASKLADEEDAWRASRLALNRVKVGK